MKRNKLLDQEIPWQISFLYWLLNYIIFKNPIFLNWLQKFSLNFQNWRSSSSSHPVKWVQWFPESWSDPSLSNKSTRSPFVSFSLALRELLSPSLLLRVSAIVLPTVWPWLVVDGFWVAARFSTAGHCRLSFAVVAHMSYSFPYKYYFDKKTWQYWSLYSPGPAMSQ